MSRPSPAPERPESIRFLALLAEASPRIGTGHVVELRNVARAALRRGVATELWLNSEAPPGLLEAAPCPVQVVADFSPDQLRNVASSLRARECAAALVSFWQIQNEQITALADFGGPVAVVDELGGVALPCDLVFNPSLVPELVAYTSSNPRFRVCGGPQ
ncbi:MAG: hypothetical protein HY329_27280, partial [Chloroflexi bacterium]|nr:hypothetical protein [Chloroflexota bacterium]